MDIMAKGNMLVVLNENMDRLEYFEINPFNP